MSATYNNDRTAERAPVDRQFEAPQKTMEETLGQVVFKGGMRADAKATVLHDRAVKIDAHMGSWKASSESDVLDRRAFEANLANEKSVTAMAKRYVDIAKMEDPVAKDAAYLEERNKVYHDNYEKARGKPYAREAANVTTNNEVKPMRAAAENAVRQGKEEEFLYEVHLTEMKKSTAVLNKQNANAQQEVRTRNDKPTLQEALATVVEPKKEPRQAPDVNERNWRNDWKNLPS